MPESVVIVSGGSRGLGLAIVRRLLASGRRVATFSRSPTDELLALQAEPEHAGRLLFTAMDARDRSAMLAFVRRTDETFGRIDALVNNAAIARDGVLALADDDELSQMLEINLLSAMRLTKECVRLMLVRGGGTIINISSIIAQRGFSGLAGYAATKGGLDAMTRALARELGARRIRVNALAPGYLETEMSQGLSEEQRMQIVRRTPLGRLGTPEDIVGWVEFLLSPEASFVTGQVITIDGGATV